MDFNELVGAKVEVEAKVSKMTTSSHSNSTVLVLVDVKVNGSYFRDHTWTKMTKRLSDLGVGDIFTATATLIKYSSVEGEKLGLKSFRNMKIL